jgi:redox-sensitive bicupin YhaK (pirin superfamily)
MLILRPSSERGHADFGWLDTYHSFSFGGYSNPEWMGFGALRVINEDVVAPGRGFAPHPHADMEIVTVVLEGALRHRDSLGTGSVIRPGEVQRMSAGSGIEHSEYNDSSTEPVHLLQLWILPDRRGGAPGYEQKAFSADREDAGLRLVASPDGADGSVTIKQDARLYLSRPRVGQVLRLPLGAGRLGWVQVARGAVRVNGQALVAGDGIGLREEPSIRVEGDGEALLFDLPGARGAAARTAAALVVA